MPLTVAVTGAAISAIEKSTRTDQRESKENIHTAAAIARTITTVLLFILTSIVVLPLAVS